jgi:hypothetical protein
MTAIRTFDPWEVSNMAPNLEFLFLVSRKRMSPRFPYTTQTRSLSFRSLQLNASLACRFLRTSQGLY